MTEHPTNAAFSRLLKERRADMEISQVDVAIEAGVPASTLSYAEGGGGLTLRNALKLARVLNINLMDLP